MALTVSNPASVYNSSTTVPVPVVPGNVKEVHVLVTMDSSYPTGGYSVTPATFGLDEEILEVIAAESSCGAGVLYIPSAANAGKLKVFCAVQTEASSTGNLSGLTVVLKVRGR
jgi:hypothetical protein